MQGRVIAYDPKSERFRVKFGQHNDTETLTFTLSELVPILECSQRISRNSHGQTDMVSEHSEEFASSSKATSSARKDGRKDDAGVRSRSETPRSHDENLRPITHNLGSREKRSREVSCGICYFAQRCVMSSTKCQSALQ